MLVSSVSLWGAIIIAVLVMMIASIVLTTDQQNFLAQRNAPNGKKTMQAYYWLICGQVWDEENPRS